MIALANIAMPRPTQQPVQQHGVIHHPPATTIDPGGVLVLIIAIIKQDEIGCRQDIAIGIDQHRVAALILLIGPHIDGVYLIQELTPVQTGLQHPHYLVGLILAENRYHDTDTVAPQLRVQAQRQ